MAQVADSSRPCADIHTGTPVLFVNHDSVAHQMYSFSPAKRFELALYHGKWWEPVMFDQPPADRSPPDCVVGTCMLDP